MKISTSNRYAVRCPDTLASIGKILYGDRWQTDLAHDLKLSDARRVRQWLSLDRPIPDNIWPDLMKLLIERRNTLNTAIDIYSRLDKE